MSFQQLIDRIPNKSKWLNQRTVEGEVRYSIKPEVLSRHLKEIQYPRTLEELTPRERNAVEREVWDILETSFVS